MGKILVFAFLFALPWGVRAERPSYCDQQWDPGSGMPISFYPPECQQDNEDIQKQADKIADQTQRDYFQCVADAQPQMQKCAGDVENSQKLCESNKLKMPDEKDGEEKSTPEGVSDSAAAVKKLSLESKEKYTSFIASCAPVQKSCLDSCNAALERVKKCELISANSEKQNVVRQSMKLVSDGIQACNNLSKVLAQAKKGEDQATSAGRDAEDVAEGTGGSTGGSDGSTAKAAGADGKKGGGGMGMPDLSGLMGQQQQAQPVPSATPIAASQGCDNPANNDRVCQCLRNPLMCQASASSAPDGLGGSTDFSSNSGGASPSGFDPNGATNQFGGVNGMNSAGPSSEVGGKQGAGAPVGGGSAFSGGGGGSTGRGGLPPNDFSTKVNSGFYGASSSGGGRSGGGTTSATAAASSVTRAPEKPDLSKFLPGQKLDPNRGPASMVGKDGITGPYDFNWDKMHRQFQRLWRQGDNFLSY